MWQHRKGIWINDQTGDLLFPWEYELEWDASRNKGQITSSQHNIQFKFVCDAKLAHRLLDKANEDFDYQLATDHVITLVNTDFPGGDQFKVQRGSLTNGVTTLALPYLEVEKRADKTRFRINGKPIDVQTDDASFKKLLRLKETLSAIYSTMTIQKPAAVGSESASLLRVFAWVYFFAALMSSLVCFTNKSFNSIVGVGFGIGVLISAFLLLTVCYVLAAISDNVRVMADKVLSESE